MTPSTLPFGGANAPLEEYFELEADTIFESDSDEDDFEKEFEFEFETGPIGQARAAASEAVRRTVERLEHAISARDDRLPIPHDVDDAMEKYFKGTRSGKLDELLARIRPMQQWILDIPAEQVTSPAPFADPFQQGVIRKAIGTGKPPAAAFPPDEPTRNPKYGASYRPTIALFPTWYAAGAEPLQPTRFLHEAFHYAYIDLRGHPKRNRWRNAFAYQGLVSALGGLPTGAVLDSLF